MRLLGVLVLLLLAVILAMLRMHHMRMNAIERDVHMLKVEEGIATHVYSVKGIPNMHRVPFKVSVRGRWARVREWFAKWWRRR